MRKSLPPIILNYLKALMLPAILYLILLLLIPDRVGNFNSIKIMFSMSVIPTIIACGVSFGFISGLLDFSVGSRIAISGMVGTICANFFGFVGLFAGCLVTSLILAVISGGLFRLLRIPSLVISLGLLMIFEVLGSYLVQFANRAWPSVSTGYYVKVPENLTFLGTTPANIIILAITLLIYYFIYYRTKFANQSRAVGSDELIARNIGIRPMQVKFITYVVGGIFLGIAAMVSACYSGSMGSQINMTTMSAVFRPIMAIVLAVSMQSLVPVPIGLFIGAFSLNIIFTGIIALGWSDDMQNIVLGLFLVIVVALPKVTQDVRNIRRRRAVRRDWNKNEEGQNVNSAT